MNPLRLYESGQVLRWHHQPQMNRRLQTNADHQWGVVAIVYGITKGDPSKELLLHALFHDVGERGAGDLSAHFKRSYPEIAELHRAAEAQEAEKIIGGLPEIWPDEKLILKAADILEAMTCIAMFANRPEECEGWPEALAALEEICKKSDLVREFCATHWNEFATVTFQGFEFTVNAEQNSADSWDEIPF